MSEGMYLDSNNTWRMVCGCTEANVLDGNHNVCRNKDDVNLEEVTLNGIISSCENLLDDLEQGAIMEDKDMQDLIYADNVILNIQQKISKQLNPSNISNTEIPSKGKGVFNHLRG
jgi:hypothetical protein